MRGALGVCCRPPGTLVGPCCLQALGLCPAPFPRAQGAALLCGPGPRSWNLISKRKQGDHGGSGVSGSRGGPF